VIYISRFFDNNAVIKHINALSLTRETNVNDVKKKINYIQNELANNNIKNRTELFEWSSQTLLTPLFLVIISLILSFEIIFLLLEMNLILTLLTSLIIILSIIFLNIIINPNQFALLGKKKESRNIIGEISAEKKSFKRPLIILSIIFLNIIINPNQFALLGKKKESRNIIGEISAEKKSFKRPLIIFSTHYDSINGKYSESIILFVIFVQIILMIVYSGIIIINTIFFLFILKNNRFIEILKITSLIFGIIYLVPMITLYLNKNNGASAQLKKDISGTAILIELAKIFKKEPLTHIELVFLWEGAQKFGLWGLRNYCKKHFFNLYKEYELNDSYNFNIDKIGEKINLVDNIGLIKRKHINIDLNPIIEAIANHMNIKLSKITIPFALPLHYKIFKRYSDKTGKKLQLSCFSLIQKENKAVLNEDLMNNTFINNINNCINLCYNVAKSLDKRIE